jgi:hypothetical protein
MPYLNNHFHVYDQHKDIVFQIVGKDNFIKFLNGYTTDRASNFGRYKFFRTYSELDKFLKLFDKLADIHKRRESIDESV